MQQRVASLCSSLYTSQGTKRTHNTWSFIQPSIYFISGLQMPTLNKVLKRSKKNPEINMLAWLDMEQAHLIGYITSLTNLIT